MDDGVELTIGEVARRAGVATSLIRYYESIGLLPEPERLHGHRRYDAAVLGRLAFIGVSQRAGFKLGEIRELVGGIDEGDALSQHIRSLSARKLDEVEELLERTRAMKGWLEVAQACGCASPDECSLFPLPGDAPAAGGFALPVVRDCRRREA